MEESIDFTDEMEESFKFLMISPNEVNFDLTMRNVITDCLDYDKPIEIREFFLKILDFTGGNISGSLVSKEIMMGIMARVLGLEEPYPSFVSAYRE